METIGRLARRFGLARSSLLYYDAIGLLRPSGRSPAGYRLYSADDVRRLEQILIYRQTGLSLADIGRILDSAGSGLTETLKIRLAELTEEIELRREQQRLIVGLLKNDRLAEVTAGILDRHTWTDLLAASGFSDEDMRQWHIQFERLAPQKHLAFLRFLAIPEADIKAIRAWAEEAKADGLKKSDA